MVKLSEVAAAANVSTKTASRAFNGKPNVSEDVRDRIFFMAEALGYERKPPAAPSGEIRPGPPAIR